MKSWTLWALMFILLVAGFSGLTSAADSARDALPDDMQDFRHINTLIIPDRDNPIFGIHHFYMNAEGLERFRAQSEGEPYPEGTRIVGKVYEVASRDGGGYKEGKLMAYTSMEKAPDLERTEDTGGWIFTKFDARGNPLEIEPARDCFHCHAPFEASDFVMSEPLP